MQQGVQITELLNATPPLAQADIIHINKASNLHDEKYTIGSLVRDKTVANLIQGSIQLINNGSTTNALVFDIESGVVDLQSVVKRVFYFTAPFTSTGVGTFTINGVTGATNLPSKTMRKGILQNIKAGTVVVNQIYQVFIDGGNAIFTSSGGGGLSTSYNGVVVNGATSVITLTNSDPDIDAYEVLKQGVKITITPNITTTANATVTLAGSNLTTTPIFAKNIDTNTYLQIGALQQLIAGVPFEVVYISDQPTVNAGNPFLLANDLSGQGFLINIEPFQQYSSTTTTNTITLSPVNGFPSPAYVNLQSVRFTADISNTGDWLARIVVLPAKQIINSLDYLPLIAGDIIATRQYEMRFDTILDKWLLIVDPAIASQINTDAGTNDRNFLTPLKLRLSSLATTIARGVTQLATQLEFFNKNSTKSITALNIFNDVRNERYSVGNTIAGLSQVLPFGNAAVGGNGYNLLTSLLAVNEDQKSNIVIPYRNIANAVQTKYLDEVNNKFLFPSNLFTYNNNNTAFTIRATVVCDIASTIGDSVKFYIRLLRVIDNSIISSKSVSQAEFPAQTGAIVTVEFKVFVETETDPFVLNGMYIDMLNDTGGNDAVTITSISVRIFKD